MYETHLIHLCTASPTSVALLVVERDEEKLKAGLFSFQVHRKVVQASRGCRLVSDESRLIFQYGIENSEEEALNNERRSNVVLLWRSNT